MRIFAQKLGRITLILTSSILLLSACQTMTPDFRYRDTDDDKDVRFYIDWDYNGVIPKEKPSMLDTMSLSMSRG